VQDLRFTRVGSCGSVAVDTRVIAATNENLEDAMARGEFRPDLYYRLNVVEITVPPLRERPEEIPALASQFLARFNAQYGRHKDISCAGMARLLQYSWPGNVRELENVIRRLVVLDGEQAIDGLMSGARGAVGAASRDFSPESLRAVARRGALEAERRALREVLDGVGWNRAEAARILKVSYKTVLNKITECGLEPLTRV